MLATICLASIATVKLFKSLIFDLKNIGGKKWQ